MASATGSKFSGWLREKLDEKRAADAQYGVRTLARKMAEKHPAGVTYGTVESYRSTLKKYLRGARPGPAMRSAIAEALGVSEDEMPTREDDEEVARAVFRLGRVVYESLSDDLMAQLPLQRERETA
jgi:hypothetical protein